MRNSVCGNMSMGKCDVNRLNFRTKRKVFFVNSIGPNLCCCSIQLMYNFEDKYDCTQSML